MTKQIKVIPQPEIIVVPGKRLGRHVEHDERSRCFSAPVAGPIVSKVWTRHAPAFKQGELGSCTGNAEAGLAMTEPFYRPDRILTEADAVAIYSEATKLDKIAGHYPPEDTGSSGVAVAKVGVRRGHFTSYRHAFSLHAALAALGRAPGMTGIPWYEGMDRPTGTRATVAIAGEVRGGHEVQVFGLDVALKLVFFWQSWGEDFGDHGRFSMTFDTYARLLSENGDFTAPTPD